MYLARINGQIADEDSETGEEVAQALEGIELGEDAMEPAPEQLPISAADPQASAPAAAVAA